MLETQSPSKHNVMRGNTTKIPHAKSTNFYDAHNAIDEPRPKRFKSAETSSASALSAQPLTSPSRRLGSEVVDSDGQQDHVVLDITDHKTELENALPHIKTDNEAIADYEATRAAQEDNTAENPDARLSQRKWVKGKSSIYVDAFNLALETVLQDESHLFDEAEKAVFEAWQDLSYEAQYLYVRLFLRKASTWHRINRLGYHGDIADIDNAIANLQEDRSLAMVCSDDTTQAGLESSQSQASLQNSFTFADKSEDHITSLEEASTLLLLDELKSIAKDAKVQGKNKGELLKALRRSSGKQTGLAFSSLNRSETDEMPGSPDSESSTRPTTPSRLDNRDTHYVQKILAETGPCIRLSLPILKLFERVHLVFYRSTEWTEKSLTTIILARIARWNFPEYIVSRSANIFPSRSLLLEFEESIRTQLRVDNILEFSGTPGKNDLQEVLDIFERILPRWRVLLHEEQKKEDSIYATGEGAYLRRLSPAWVYTRIVHKGAYVLGKFKHHKREHETLTELLDQKLLHTSRRGDWYQRKALLEEHYMHALESADGKTDEAQKKHYRRVALQTCETGLEDRLVHVIYHHDLQKRVMKLEKALKIPKRQQHEFGHVRLAKAVERTFYGVQLVRASDAAAARADESMPATSSAPVFRRSNSNSSQPTRRSTKTVWLNPEVSSSQGTSEETCSVESICLAHYRATGYKGYHSEGGILKTLFGYLFFDVLFLYIPNVFQTAYQACPLDLHTDAFYPSRLSEINARLNEISNGEAGQIIQRVWTAHNEKRTCVVGLNWSFELDDLLSIARCFPGAALGTICKVLAQEYGQRGGGVPDLFLWKEEVDESGHVMFAEVKSENDRLSDTQRLWIDIISGTGVRVEKCNALAKEVRVVD